MFRKFTVLLVALTFCWTTVACSDVSTTNQSRQPNSVPVAVSPSNQVTSGRYSVQQATYDDVDGTYTLMLLNTPSGTAPMYQTTNLQMARLTDEAIAKGEKTSVEINGDQATMYLTEDFKIEYVHNVTEVQENPQTGVKETVIVRQESNFWTPFAGALAGQALGSLLFRPQYYVPPVYYPGTTLSGYGGYGTTYNRAIESYRTKHNTVPVVEKNRQVVRTTGGLKRYPSSPSTTTRRPSPSSTGTRTSGSGYGSSKLRTSNKSSGSPSVTRSPSFGTRSGSRRPSSSRRRR